MGKDHKHDYTPEEWDAQERFWLGPRNRFCHTIYQMQKDTTNEKWVAAEDNTTLDPNFSEFSVRIFDPKAVSLSFIYRTICILPKSRLRSIYNLIGEYLNAFDKKNT